MTHLIFSEDERYLVGYFTLTIKPISIVQDVFDNFSRKTRNKILRIAKLDKDTNSYALSAYLTESRQNSPQLFQNKFKSLIG